MKASPRAYSYLRFSSPVQAHGDSVRRQTELRDAWLARNQATLDTSLTLEDKGVSGFTGRHRENPDRHALAAFLALVRKGRVPRGSALIVESLDRLSREDITPALSLLLDLIQSGVRVVQLMPVEVIYDAQSNPMQLMMAIMELSRGHSESAMKSERVGAAWAEKKRRAAEKREPLTARTPAWLRLIDGEWEVDERAADTIRRIYKMATDGYGLGVITRRLNAERVPVITGGNNRVPKHWARSYVAKLLIGRAVVGEYTPHTGRKVASPEHGDDGQGKRRRPDGKPIAGYYPAVISEAVWYAARAAMAGRRGRAGRLPAEHINVFAGLLHSALDGGTLQMVNKGKKGGGRLLVPYKAVQGVEGARATSFPFSSFEWGVLTCLREIDPTEVLPQDKKGPNRTEELAGRILELDGEIEKMKQRLQKRYSDAVADVLERREDDLKELAEQLRQAQQAAAAPLKSAWGDCMTLLDAIQAAPDSDEARIRLRGAVRRVVEGIWCLFVSRGSRRLAAVQVCFTGGARRDFLIMHLPALGGSVCARPVQRAVRSLDDVAALGELDLRQPDAAVRLEKALRAVPVEPLRRLMFAPSEA
jgi:DNA invertase Pin-like site-specific DNA recombinase